MSPRIRQQKHLQYQIVVADDDADDREMLMEAVRNLDYSVVVTFAMDGVNLVEYLHDLLKRRLELPHLVLMDINMPRMNGIEALRTIKQHKALSELPVAALTTSTDELDKKTMVDLGACGYYTKPTDLNRYKQLLHDVLVECLPKDLQPVKSK